MISRDVIKMIEPNVRAELRGGGRVGETWVFFSSDTHYTPNQNQDAGDPVDRHIAAHRSIPGSVYPLGGTIGTPTMIINGGDCVHDGEETTERFASHHWDRFIDGNHDTNPTRDLIIQRFGSLTWGVKVGPIWIQAFTEEWTNLTTNSPPSAAQINGPVAASLAARPAGEPTIFLFHRALNGGYLAEWASDALDALDTLANSLNIVCFLHGHNHYSNHYTWTGPVTSRPYRVFTPGSHTQSPVGGPPFSTIYPESFLVMRFGNRYIDVASYIFGFDLSRPLSGGVVGGTGWAPGTWAWSERVTY